MNGPLENLPQQFKKAFLNILDTQEVDEFIKIMNIEKLQLQRSLAHKEHHDDLSIAVYSFYDWNDTAHPEYFEELAGKMDEREYYDRVPLIDKLQWVF